MTSEEIKATLPYALSSDGWLKEIAFQLALLNEKQTEKAKKPIYDRSRPHQ